MVLTIPIPSEMRPMLNRTPNKLAHVVRLGAALMLLRLGKLSSAGSRFDTSALQGIIRRQENRYA